MIIAIVIICLIFGWLTGGAIGFFLTREMLSNKYVLMQDTAKTAIESRDQALADSQEILLASVDQLLANPAVRKEYDAQVRRTATELVQIERASLVKERALLLSSTTCGCGHNKSFHGGGDRLCFKSGCACRIFVPRQ